MFSDALKAIRAGLSEMAREFKRRRWLRKYRSSIELPF
jgi:hypothetical protein